MKIHLNLSMLQLELNFKGIEVYYFTQFMQNDEFYKRHGCLWLKMAIK
jgi:hypothetical protein